MSGREPRSPRPGTPAGGIGSGQAGRGQAGRGADDRAGSGSGDTSGRGQAGGDGPRTLGGTELKRLHREWRRRTEGRLALLLDGVGNPYNVGSIIRTAAALGVEHLWLAGDCASPNATKTQKTALGTQRYLRWTRCDDPLDAAAEARAAGYHLVGLELAQGARPLHEVATRADVCLAVGHEDRGISRPLLAACDDLAYLPQVGRVGSLNVATATSIGLYELRRRTW